MKQPVVVAFGGGVNSAAMLVGMHEREEAPDLILFADTGGEKPETYAFIEKMSLWTEARFGVPVITVRASQKTDATLEANCLRLGFLPSIVYGFKKCSQRWKAEPQEKYCNRFSWKLRVLASRSCGISTAACRSASRAGVSFGNRCGWH